MKAPRWGTTPTVLVCGHADRLGDRRGEVVARAVGERAAVDDGHGDRLAGEEDRDRRAARQGAVGDAEQRVAHDLSARGVLAVEARAEPGRAGGPVDGDAGGERRGVGGLGLGAGDQRAHGEAADLVGAPARQEGAVGRDRRGRGLRPRAAGHLALDLQRPPGLLGAHRAAEAQRVTEHLAGAREERRRRRPTRWRQRRRRPGTGRQSGSRYGGAQGAWSSFGGLRGELTGSRRTSGATGGWSGFAPADRHAIRSGSPAPRASGARRLGRRAAAYPNQGRGKRPSADFSARPPAARPICASSPAAWTAVVTSWAPCGTPSSSARGVA